MQNKKGLMSSSFSGPYIGKKTIGLHIMVGASRMGRLGDWSQSILTLNPKGKEKINSLDAKPLNNVSLVLFR